MRGDEAFLIQQDWVGATPVADNQNDPVAARDLLLEMGDECASHASLQHEHQDEERFRVTWLRNMVEAVNHDEQCDHHRQDVERQADAIETDEVTALDQRNPLVLSNELH